MYSVLRTIINPIEGQKQKPSERWPSVECENQTPIQRAPRDECCPNGCVAQFSRVSTVVLNIPLSSPTTMGSSQRPLLVLQPSVNTTTYVSHTILSVLASYTTRQGGHNDHDDNDLRAYPITFSRPAAIPERPKELSLVSRQPTS